MNMSEQEQFSNVQERYIAVMAKHEWKSSLMNMQKSSEEIHDRRTKSNRKANEFLQELLKKRSDGSLLDDNGIIDRYEKFRKYKLNLNDDDLLNEFERRLNGLNNKNRRNYYLKNFHANHQQAIKVDSQTTTDDNESNTEYLDANDRLKPISRLMTTSTSTSDIMDNSFISCEENPINIFFNIDASYSSSLEQSSTSSMTKPLYRPVARRVDGSEVTVNSTVKPIRRASSDVLILKHCFFPRSLKLRESIKRNSISEKKLPSLPIQMEQYDNKQLFPLLDRIENSCSSNEFTTMLDQVTISTVYTHPIDNNNISIESDSDDDIEENVLIIPNLFEPSSLSDDYYTTFTINIDNPEEILLYTMTIGIVQFSPSFIVPYSILMGRRPLLQCSIKTNFKKIHSKQTKSTCQVTAIETVTNIESLKENDIILKINDQSVWCLTTDTIRDMLKQAKNYSLTIVRLYQPFKSFLYKN